MPKYLQKEIIKILFRTNLVLTRLTFTCSKSTIETLQKGVKYVQI